MAIFFRPPEPTQAVPKVLPRTPGSEPPRSVPLGGSSAVLAAVGMWAAAAAVPMPTQKPLNVVALTLTYGAQPPRSGQLTGANDVAEMTAILAGYPQAGEPRLPAVIAAPPSAAWNVPPVNAPRPYTPYPLAVWIASPSPSWQAPALVTVAPLTLVYGQQPPRYQSKAVAFDAPWWSAQSAAPNASWNLPVVGYVPPATPKALQSPALWWPAQSAAPTAAWNFTPPVVNTATPQTPYPFAAILQWVTMWTPPRPVAIAPLTLRYGAQPPPGPAFAQSIAIAIAQQWPALWWPAQTAAPSAPLTLIYGQRPPIIGARVPPAALIAWYPDWGTQRYPPIAAELQILLGVPSLPGINHVAFDASITTVVFDALATRVVFDANGTVIVLDSLRTSMLADSLITQSVFDG